MQRRREVLPPSSDDHPRTIFCLAGVPAAGKSTIRHQLCLRYPTNVSFLRRWTTRRVRPGEEDEVVHLKRGAFVRKTNQRLLTGIFCSNHTMYGISVEELEALLRSGTRWIGCISASAGLSLHAIGYEVLVIYLTVRDRRVLLDRLRARGHREKEIATRMHEFDDADAEWRDVSGDCVLATDSLSVEETVQAVIRLLRLPTGTLLPT